MADVNVPYSQPGQAAFEQLDTWNTTFFLSGSEPPLLPINLNAAPSAVLPFLKVVGLGPDGIVPATFNADPALAIKPVGVMNTAVVGAADGSTPAIFWYSGCFDPDALLWDPSFDTLGKKMTAFNGSPSPTQIIMRQRAPLA